MTGVPETTVEAPFRQRRAELAASIERVLHGELRIFESLVLPAAWPGLEVDPKPVAVEWVRPVASEVFAHHAEAVLRLTQAWATLTNPSGTRR